VEPRSGDCAGCMPTVRPESRSAQAIRFRLNRLLNPRPSARWSGLLRSSTVPELDATDLRLLLALAEDPRATTVALADRLRLSRNTVQARMTSLSKAGAFRGYDRSIDPAVAGFSLVAFTTVQVRQQVLADIVEALARIPEIVQAHGISGSADLLLRIVARSAEELFRVEAAVLAIEGVERTETVLAIQEVLPYRLGPLLSSLLLEE
jgi:DNA-binding Lrp family transcriptional regulator